ncbi:MAG: hypothetical protein WC389_12985 [Lutibacter sp.]|jgi:hypothetical protein
MVIDPSWHKVLIDCEIENIKYYSQEIGFYKKLLEKQDDDATCQWFNYFISYAENEIEAVNDRLKKLREDLCAWGLQHPDN